MISKLNYKIAGMTCNGCVNAVTKKLGSLDEVEKVDIQLDEGLVTITVSKEIDFSKLKEVLQPKYSISKIADSNEELEVNSSENTSKIKQLKPLLLILLFISVASVLLHLDDRDTMSMMYDFMGLFFIVFSFFKFLDLSGFSQSFSMYDPLAKLVPSYATIYPFIELALGISILYRFKLLPVMILTILILGITTYGVIQVLLSNKAIRCACLGTALKLPMTEATLIENLLMITMSSALIFKLL